jgi:hypothetical protein
LRLVLKIDLGGPRDLDQVVPHRIEEHILHGVWRRSVAGASMARPLFMNSIVHAPLAYLIHSRSRFRPEVRSRCVSALDAISNVMGLRTLPRSL